MDLLAELVALEERLLRLGSGCDRACVESLLAADYVAFGSSGRMFTKTTLMSELGEMAERQFVMTGAVCHRMSEGAALLTYRVRMGERKTLRSSLWVQRDGRWQLQFHQGTVAAVQ